VTSPDAIDELDKLFLLVVRAAHDARPELLGRPLEVAELVDLVPYKAVRCDIGVDTNDDYHHAVTRLLAGERGYVFADELMQDDLRAELSSPNPDLAAYRSYLNARVTLSQERLRAALETFGLPAPPPAAPTPVHPVSPREAATARPRATPSPTAVVDESLRRRAARPGCRYCGQALPEGREVRYCPHCGQNQLTRRCPACSAELEAGWTFCVACGRAVVA